MENRRSIICESNSGDAQVTLEVCAGDPRYRIMRFTISESLRDCLFINKKKTVVPQCQLPVGIIIPTGFLCFSPKKGKDLCIFLDKDESDV